MTISVLIDAPAHAKSESGLERKGSIESLVTSCLFVALVFGLAIFTVLRFSIPAGTISLQEKREFASCPHLRLNKKSLSSFASGFDAFYNDRVAFRYVLINLLARIKYEAFSLSPTEKVLIGKHGWLFFTDAGDLQTLRRRPLFSPLDLEQWNKMLEERRAWCASKKIKFLFVIVPTKSSIYREYVPPEFTSLSQETRADQLLRYLKCHSAVETLDLRTPVFNAKSKGQLYCKTDTHWNGLGGFIGYQAIVARLQEWFPQLSPISEKDTECSLISPYSGDLANMLGLDGLIREDYIRMAKRKPHGWHYAAFPQHYEPTSPALAAKPFATETLAKNAPRGFFIRDSFLMIPQQFLSEHFKRAYFDWTATYDFPLQAVESEAPDVLVFEILERHLCRAVPVNPPSLQNTGR
jgi:hypothetical protein